MRLGHVFESFFTVGPQVQSAGSLSKMCPCPDTHHTLHCQPPGLSPPVLTHLDVRFWIASTFPPMYPEAYEPAFSSAIYLEWNWRFKMEYVSLQ